MVMSTPTLASASALICDAVLVDSVYLCSVGEPVTTGFSVARPVTRISEDPVRGLVQTTVLQGAVESEVSNLYSIKVDLDTDLQASMAVEVATCQQEPDLVGKILLVDKISMNGLALIRKGVASDFYQVNQQGKGEL